MKTIYNFSAGPACLPQSAIEGAKEAIKDFQGSGISLLEMSHRSTPVVNLFEETTNNLRDLLKIPDKYDIIWLQGGLLVTRLYLVSYTHLTLPTKA